ncbi:hypothetical protein [Mycetocola tolaasinivorans]|uniref:hypothetical protein n=1 Tax=Mycetocola tolaasinivorans TaxID=76635 RepID=UPI0015FF39D4|nr:hypothetical protein [Mycetocola tolaasinivorans]
MSRSHSLPTPPTRRVVRATAPSGFSGSLITPARQCDGVVRTGCDAIIPRFW